MAKPPLFKKNSGNNAGLLKSRTLGLLLLAFLAVKVFIAIVVPASRPFASDLTTDNILNAVNQQRSLRDLTTLNLNSKLAWAAQSKSDDMQARHYFAHVDPDGHYIWDKIVAAGYTPYLELGENLAIEFYDTDSLVSAWMNSPEHRANILNAGFQDQGMGLTLGSPADGQYYSAITNTFGTLAPIPKAQASPAPAATAPVAKAPAPKPKTTPAPKPKTLGNQQTTSSSSVATITPAIASSASSSVLSQPILPRQTIALAQNPQSNFSLPSQPAQASSSTSTPSQPKLAVVGNLNNNPYLTNYQLNRYLLLFAGVILLMLMLSDIKKSVQLKFSHLDKKFNNLVVLIISLVVIAFMYWL